MNKIYIVFQTILLTVVFASGCSSSGDGGAVPVITQAVTYSTTSARGDYSEWTLTGSILDAIWKVVRDDGSIDYTHDFTATCGAPDSTGIRSCSVTTSSCTDGVSVCPAPLTGSFDMMAMLQTAQPRPNR